MNITTIYNLPSDIIRYQIFTLLDLAERLYFKVAVYGSKFPTTINSILARHGLRFVKPFLRCYIDLEPEYLPALDRKWIKRIKQPTEIFDKYELIRKPRLENIVILFATYNGNNELLKSLKIGAMGKRKQHWCGRMKRGFYVPLKAITNMCNIKFELGHYRKYGINMIRMCIASQHWNVLYTFLTWILYEHKLKIKLINLIKIHKVYLFWNESQNIGYDECCRQYQVSNR